LPKITVLQKTMESTPQLPTPSHHDLVKYSSIHMLRMLKKSSLLFAEVCYVAFSFVCC